MTTRVWNGGTASFNDRTAWTPEGTPASGDSLYIVTGTAEAGPGTLKGLSIQLGAAPVSSVASGPAVLQLWNTVIGSNTNVSVGGTFSSPPSGPGSATIETIGVATNLGTISASGFTVLPSIFPSNPSQLTIELNGNVGQETFNNVGTLAAHPNGTLTVEGRDSNAHLLNNGLIDVGSNVFLDLDVLGIGKMEFGGFYAIRPTASGVVGTSLETASGVGDGQTVEFQTAGGGDSRGLLRIDDPQDFHALIRDFVAGGLGPSFVGPDTIALNMANVTAGYQGDSSGGVLTLAGGGQVAHLRFAGSYSLDSFNIGTDSSGTTITVKQV